MPKRVNGQEGDLGTPVALEKKMRGTGEMASGRMATRSVTRALSNKGSQDPLSSSESDQLLQKSKEDSNVFADMTGSKKGSQDPLSRLESDQLLQKSREDSNVFADMTGSKKGSQDLLSSSESDQLLLKSKEDSNVSVDMTGMRGRNGCIFEDPYEGCQRPVVKIWDTKKELEEVKIAMIEFDKWAEQHKRNYGSRKERNNRFLVYLQNKRNNDAFLKLRPDCFNHGYNKDHMDKMIWEI